MARHRQRRHGPSHATLMVAGTLCGLVLGGGLVAAAAVPLPSGPPTLVTSLPPAPDTGAAPVLPFPSQGQSAVAIPTMGVFRVHNAQVPVPVASLTKLMTAYVALRALPLGPAATGPSLVVTAADVAEYQHDLKTGQSCIKVVAGEVLTERQLFDGMLVHSASNYATMLSRMTMGSNAAMVAQMNASAVRLGMTASHFADVSGLSAKSQSSAQDLLRLSTLLMRDVTFSEVVRQPQVTLPVAGTVGSYTPYIGRPGVVGVKTGTTIASGGCMVMAFDVNVGGRVVQILDVVLGQRSVRYDLLKAAGRSALVLASGTAHNLHAWVVTQAGAPAGTLGWPSRTVPVVARSTIVVPTFPGVPTSLGVAESTWGTNEVASGTVVATVFVRSGGYREVTQLATSATLTRPDLWDRVR